MNEKTFCLVTCEVCVMEVFFPMDPLLSEINATDACCNGRIHASES